MNKRIIIILLLLCIPTVFAKEETIKKYKYYYTEREYGPYSSQISEEFPYVDKNNFIYTNFTETEEKPENLENREIEEVYYYKYKRIKNTDYIKIKNNASKINISNIELKYNGEDIEYDIVWPNDGEKSISKGQFMTIRFNKEIDQSLLNLKIESDASGSGINIITGDSVCAQSIYRCTINHNFEWNGTNATYYSYSSWVEDIYPFKLNTSRTVIYLGKTSKYKYRDKLYKTYREIRKYSEDYLNNPEEPYIIRDENNYVEEIVKSKVEDDISEGDNILETENHEITDDTPQYNDILETAKHSELAKGNSDASSEKSHDKIMTNLKEENQEEAIKREIVEVPNTGISYPYKLLTKEALLHLHFLPI